MHAPSVNLAPTSKATDATLGCQVQVWRGLAGLTRVQVLTSSVEPALASEADSASSSSPLAGWDAAQHLSQLAVWQMCWSRPLRALLLGSLARVLAYASAMRPCTKYGYPDPCLAHQHSTHTSLLTSKSSSPAPWSDWPSSSCSDLHVAAGSTYGICGVAAGYGDSR